MEINFMHIEFTGKQCPTFDTVVIRLPAMGIRLKNPYFKFTSESHVERTMIRRKTIKSQVGIYDLVYSHYVERGYFELSCSLAGVVYGQNIFGDARLSRELNKVIHIFCDQTGIEGRDRDALLAVDPELHRVDLSLNYRFADAAQVRRVMENVHYQFVPYKQAGRNKNTAYFGADSGSAWQVCFYDKGQEVRSHNRSERKDSGFWERLMAEAETLLRVEVRVHRQELVDSNLSKVSVWKPRHCRDVFNTYFGRVPTLIAPAAHLAEHMFDGLTITESRQLAAFAAGAPMDKLYAGSTLKAIKTGFKKKKIDVLARVLHPGDPGANCFWSDTHRIAEAPQWLVDAGRAPVWKLKSATAKPSLKPQR